MYSSVTDALGIRKLLPENYRNTYETLGTLTPETSERTGLPQSTIVTMGIHDSNASLLPYLAKDDHRDFVLNSTGTWCVSMHPQDNLDYNPDDIGKIVFFNQSALRRPVKTSIFLGGMEFDTYITLYKELNGTDEFPAYDPDAFRQILAENDTYLLPEIVPGSGQFNTSKPGILEKGVFYPIEEIRSGKNIPSVFCDGGKFLAVLDTSLVIQTVTALKRAGMKKGTKIFTEGGFRKNKGYNTLLASVLPENSVHLTNMKEATAFGAAMTAVMAYTGKTHTDLAGTINIEYTSVPPDSFPGYGQYRDKWLAAAR